MSVAYYNGQQINNFADATKINYKAYYNNYILFGADADTGETPTDYSEQYLTFVALTDGTFVYDGTSTDNNLSYSTDNGVNWSTPSYSITVNVGSGDKVMWKGNIVGSGNKRFSGGTASFDIQGNIMSLIYGDNFIGQTSLNNLTFKHMFANSEITNAENLILPATTLSDECYANMFENCTSLTTAPQLLATTLGIRSYMSMFFGCTSLTTAPQLPATTLAHSCYLMMFWYCTSLTTAPDLLATTLNIMSYSHMFYGCSNLNYIKMLATDISAYNCLGSWVVGVANSGTLVKAASMESLPSGDNGIPNGWTVQNATE